MKKVALLVVLFASLTISESPCLTLNDKEWHEADVWVGGNSQTFEVPVASIDNIRCKTHNGSVTFIATETQTISVTAIVAAGGEDDLDAQECLDEIEVIIEESGNDLLVEWRLPNPRSTWGAVVAYIIEQPGNIAVDAQTQNGTIRLTGIEAPARVQTDNGDISLTNCSGSLRVQTLNGSIVADCSSSNLDVKTHNGPIKFVLETDGPINGSIETHNGALSIDFRGKASAKMTCETHHGSVSASDSFQKIHAERLVRKGELICKFVGGIGNHEGDLRVTNHSGSIRLSETRPTELGD